MKKIIYSAIAIATLSMFSACDDNEGGSQVDVELNTQILEEFSANVAQASYNDLKTKAGGLYTNIITLSSDGGKTTPNLEACRTSWKASRAAWEQTESFLFGPVSTEDVDPRIDTWPVDFNVLTDVMDSENEFTQEFINNTLGEGEKGFHAIEYLIFGEDGTKTAEELTPRELEFLNALGLNLKTLTTLVADGWNPSVDGNYHEVFTTAGNGIDPYEKQQDAFTEMVSAMAGICDEVANGKISEPFLAEDPSLEESPYSGNSITDFTNNMKGVENVYLGKYSTDGKGLEDLVRKYNLQLDGEIKAKISAAITALNNITDPFGEATTSQPIQVQNAIDAINDLSAVLEEDLFVFVQQHSK